MLPKLNLQASTLTDINNAMWAVRVVTVHDKTLSYKGWNGDGYSIVDPNTGAGAYLINGGANGGFLPLLTGIAQGMAVTSLGVAVTTAILTLGPVGMAFVALVSILLFALIGITALYSEFTFNDYQNSCREFGYPLGAAIAGAIVVGYVSMIAGIFSAIFGIVTIPVMTPIASEGTIDCATN